MDPVLPRVFLLVYFLVLVAIAVGCPNDCSQKGICTNLSTCKCFDGYEGNDCSRRTCPKGPALADIPYAADSAHADAVCSGNGQCDYKTGTCTCNDGFYGQNCGRTKCFNDCSGRGRCVSLREAAQEYDGYHLNHTTTYNLWDADVIYGCVCDYGFTGADCSQRTCEYGLDPREADFQHERVNLVCTCDDSGCTGKFKLRLFGSVLKIWLYPSSTTADLLYALQTAPGITMNSTIYTIETMDSNRTASQTLCSKGRTIHNIVHFKRNAGDLPAVSIYANLITKGSVYFETQQTIICDCRDRHCNGTFRVSFDDEMSSAINGFSNGTEIIRALSTMNTLAATPFTVNAVSGYNEPICARDQVHNFTFAFRGSAGNAPKIGLWSSVQLGQNFAYYTTNSSQNDPLRLVTNDGRDDHVKLCNGIGKCDFSTGICTCPFRWKYDANVGPCGQLDIPSSQWTGLGRCPGVIPLSLQNSDAKRTRDSDNAYTPRVYLSFNPYFDVTNSSVDIYSTIRYFNWRAATLIGPVVDEYAGTLFLNLTSNSSAGPLLVDSAKDQVVFVDVNVEDPFIGKAPQYGPYGNYTRWYSLAEGNARRVFSITFDARPWVRRLYWSIPGALNAVDGDIYYALLDEVMPTVSSLRAAIGFNEALVSPYGIALHYYENRLYWADRNVTNDHRVSSTGHQHGVLRSCYLDGSGYRQDYVLDTTTEGISLSPNYTDIVIDYTRNHTMFLVNNNGSDSMIIAIALAIPDRVNNASRTDDYGKWSLNFFYHSPRLVLDSAAMSLLDLRYLALDVDNTFLLFSDASRGIVGYRFYNYDPDNTFQYGIGFSGMSDGSIEQRIPRAVVGLALDFGMGKLYDDSILDCYGRGRCLGLEGNYVCECDRGFYGDCQAAQCPTGPSWWHEPFVADIAHDIDVECSNAGLCDRFTGTCTCFDGFEGHACQRRTCPATDLPGSACSGQGACLTMRQLGTLHKDEYLDVDPVSYTLWDADRIQGCKAYEYGYYFGEFNVSSPRDVNIARYDCPMGFNPRLRFENASSSIATAANFNHTHYFETQQIECNAFRGYFKLSFRGATTSKINANSTSAELQATLEALPTLGPVLIDMPAPTLCVSYQVTYTNITFLAQAGKVPLMTVEENYLGGRRVRIKINRVRASAPGEIYECSGHGNCNFLTGKCDCYPQYGSSDGNGGPGTRADCGHNIFS